MMTIQGGGQPRRAHAAALVLTAALAALGPSRSAHAEGVVAPLGPGAVIVVGACEADGSLRDVTVIDTAGGDAPMIVSGAVAQPVSEDGASKLLLRDGLTIGAADAGATTVYWESLLLEWPPRPMDAPVAPTCAALQEAAEAARQTAAAATRSGGLTRATRAEDGGAAPDPSAITAACGGAVTASDLIFVSTGGAGAVDAVISTGALRLDANEQTLLIAGDETLIALSGEAMDAAALRPGRLLAAVAVGDGYRLLGLSCSP